MVMMDSFRALARVPRGAASGGWRTARAHAGPMARGGCPDPWPDRGWGQAAIVAKRPLLKSSLACRISFAVFMTKGPCMTTGSWVGLPLRLRTDAPLLG